MLVVDASVIMKVLTEEVGSDLAVERLAQAPARTAPDWLTVEIASALSKKIRYGGLANGSGAECAFGGPGDHA